MQAKVSARIGRIGIFYFFQDMVPQQNQDVINMLHKYSLRHSYIVLTVSSHYTSSSLAKNFDTRLVLMGLATDLQEDLVHHYTSITETPQELYASLLAKVLVFCGSIFSSDISERSKYCGERICQVYHSMIKSLT